MTSIRMVITIGSYIKRDMFREIWGTEMPNDMK